MGRTPAAPSSPLGHIPIVPLRPVNQVTQERGLYASPALRLSSVTFLDAIH